MELSPVAHAQVNGRVSDVRRLRSQLVRVHPAATVALASTENTTTTVPEVTTMGLFAIAQLDFPVRRAIKRPIIVSRTRAETELLAYRAKTVPVTRASAP